MAKDYSLLRGETRLAFKAETIREVAKRATREEVAGECQQGMKQAFLLAWDLPVELAAGELALKALGDRPQGGTLTERRG